MAVDLVGAGIAEGVTRGLQGYTEGLKQADNIQYQRQLRRQQAVQFETQQTQAEQQIEKNAFELAQLRKQAYGSDVKQAMINFYASGKKNIVMLNSAINSNPDLKKTTFGDLTEFQPLSTYSDETLQTIGYDPSMGDKNSYIVALESNGNKTLINLDKMAMSMGVVGELQGKELEAKTTANAIQTQEIENKFNQAQSNIINHIQKMYEGNEIDFNAYQKLMQNAKLGWGGNASNINTMMKQEQAEKLKQAQDRYVNGTFTVDDLDLIYSSLKTDAQRASNALSKLTEIYNSNNLARLMKENPSAVSYLANYALKTEEGKAIAKSFEETSDFNGLFANLNTAVGALKDGWNPNIVSKTVNSLLSYLPTSSKFIDENTIRDKLGSQAFQGAYTAILKILSGATVTDGERASFESFLGGIGRDSLTMLTGIKAFLQEKKSKYDFYNKPLASIYFGGTMENINKSLEEVDSLINKTAGGANRKTSTKEPASNLYKQQGNSSANDLSNIYRDINSLRSIGEGASK